MQPKRGSFAFDAGTHSYYMIKADTNV